MLGLSQLVAACNSVDAMRPPGALGEVAVNLLVVGPGSVSVAGVADPCTQGTCSYVLPRDSRLRLVSAAGEKARFEVWSGDCAGDQAAIELGLDGPKSCTASFRAQRELTLGTTGGGAISGGGIGCGVGTCSGLVDDGTTIVLRASASAGYRFVRWTGTPACDDQLSSEISVPISADVRCVAEFRRRVSVAGAASGAAGVQIGATYADPWVTCGGGRCEIDAGTQVVLSAPTVAGYYLSTWMGCSGAQGASLTMYPLEDTTCTAVYAPGIAIVGSVVGAPPGTQILATSPTAGADCQAQAGACRVPPGASVTLAPQLVSGYRFAGWSGDPGCSGSTALTFTNVQSSRTCTATYRRLVTVVGAVQSGLSGTVQVASDGFFCAAGSCTVDEGATVRLTAPSIAGQVFVGWTGTGCPVLPVSSAPPLAADLTAGADRACTAAYITTAQAQPPVLVDLWPSPTGWITEAGSAIRASVDTSGRDPRSTWECRTARVALVDQRPFAACAAVYSPPAGANGAQRTDVRLRVLSYAGAATSHLYYAHDSLNGARRCPDTLSDDAIFAAAAQVLAPEQTFPSGLALAAPFVHLAFRSTTYDLWSVPMPGGVDPVAPTAFDVMSLRHRFALSADGKLLLMRRRYESRRVRQGAAVSACHDRHDFGWDWIEYADHRFAGNPRKTGHACVALVVDARGFGVCVRGDVAGANVAPGVSLQGWRKLIRETHFSPKRREPCSPGSVCSALYMPD